MLLTLLLPLALLVMLESLLATISTSFADITMQVELSSPERQLLRKAKGKKKNQTGLHRKSTEVTYLLFTMLTATQKEHLCI